MIRMTNLCLRLVLLGLCLATAGCMGPNPWTDDPVTECRSMGLAPGSTSFNECMILSKEMQLGRNEPAASTSPKPSAEIETQKLQSRSCNMSTGVCAPALLKQ